MDSRALSRCGGWTDICKLQSRLLLYEHVAGFVRAAWRVLNGRGVWFGGRVNELRPAAGSRPVARSSRRSNRKKRRGIFRQRKQEKSKAFLRSARVRTAPVERTHVACRLQRGAVGNGRQRKRKATSVTSDAWPGEPRGGVRTLWLLRNHHQTET